MSYRTSGIETPKYTIVEKYDGFEIRQYDSMIVAQTTIEASTYKKSASTGFRRIAGYIFGNNKQKQEIAMTSPVFMEMGESTKMAFVMPKQYNLSDLPNPNAKEVTLVKVDPKKYAVIRFSGFASDKKIKRQSEKLTALLKTNQIETKGSFSFLGYNAPWELFGRRNEVAIQVQ
jgi:hypothetical protein